MSKYIIFNDESAPHLKGAVTVQGSKNGALPLIAAASLTDGAALAGELRSSVFMLGAILCRVKHAAVAYPGGCVIGLRPIDLHLKAFREMGVKIRDRYGYIRCDATNTRAADIDLDYPSVGATENVMMLAAGTRGVTTLKNAAREPEIVALQQMINSMGGNVSGAGTPIIKIEGIEKFNGAETTVDFDHCAAATSCSRARTAIS